VMVVHCGYLIWLAEMNELRGGEKLMFRKKVCSSWSGSSRVPGARQYSNVPLR
jgi:hypothetical protein